MYLHTTRSGKSKTEGQKFIFNKLGINNFWLSSTCQKTYGKLTKLIVEIDYPLFTLYTFNKYKLFVSVICISWNY